MKIHVNIIILKKKAKNAINVYEDIAQRMLEQLEAGTAPWRRPWSSTSGRATNRANGKVERPSKFGGSYLTVFHISVTLR